MSEQKTNSFSIINILQYVRKNSQTGRLALHDGGRPLAELYFNKGHLIHAKNDKVVGDDVVYQLLSNKTAQIRWERNVAPPEETVSKTDEVLLLGALGILTEADASDVLNVVSSEAEDAMDNAFDEPAIPASGQFPAVNPGSGQFPAVNPGSGQFPVATAGSSGQIPAVRPNPAGQVPAVNPQPRAPQTSVSQTQIPTVRPQTTAATSQNIPILDDAFVGAPPVGTPAETPAPSFGNNSLEGLGRLQNIVGDEVLRPPRFKKWSGLPLPFISAYAFDPSDRQVKTSYDLLWKEKFSGVLSVIYGQTEAMMLLYKGRAVHSRIHDGKTLYKDQNALRRIIDIVVPPNEKNLVLIYPLEADFIHSYAALIMGEPELTGLSSQSVKINKLLNTLEQAQRTGVVHVTNGDENGYIFLSNGHKLGSYYEVEDVLEESILRVYQIVGKSGSTIDVLTSPPEDRLFEFASRPKSGGEIKQQIIDIANEVFGKRSGRVVQLISQSEDNAPALKTYCNQARRVAQMFIDKGLADQFYERAMFLLQDMN
jgi:hypothetical protein